MMMIPVTTKPTNTPNNLFFTTFLSMTMLGNESAVTAIMKDKAVPIPTPLETKASAMGKVPKISAYMGTPTKVASGTEYHLSTPKTAVMKLSGITLWMSAPIPTPIKTYNQTFWTISLTPAMDLYAIFKC